MRLKELRKKRGLSQQRLAMELNVNQNTISRYETGEREADYKSLIMLADYFGVSIDYLLERTDVNSWDEKKTRAGLLSGRVFFYCDDTLPRAGVLLFFRGQTSSSTPFDRMQNWYSYTINGSIRCSLNSE